MSNVTIHAGDNRATLRRLIDDGVRVHSVVTDPPYGLVSIQTRFGNSPRSAATENQETPFGRTGRGFMGQRWDGTQIERDPEFWRLIWDILLPGGYVFAFSGSRTGHWQACAMETAGFVMHPMHGWVFGSGFPKAHSARAAGAEWDGWAYGTQSQKPALEPIYLGQKPFSEKTGVANLLKHGVGAVNLDECRVSAKSGDEPVSWASPRGGIWRTDADADAELIVTGKGRHPANLILDGSPEVVAMFPVTKSGKPGVMRKGTNDGACYGAESRAPGTQMTGFGDEGSAARFFHQFGPDADPIFYHPKASKADRAGSKHPTVKPIALVQYLIRHITPPGGIVLDPFAGSGTTAEAAQREGFDCILMEAEPDYLDFLHTRFSSVLTLDSPEGVFG